MQRPYPFLSVIIPFYNDERFLSEAIESVLNQTFTDWELLLINDGSTDKSTEIAHQYASAFPQRIRCLNHPGNVNKGLTATRNLGFAHAKGNWIALLDSDDTWLPEKLSAQVAIAKSYPQCALICEASLYWHSWQDEDKKDDLILVGGGLEGLYPPPGLLPLLYPFGKGAAPCPSSMLIKKEVLSELGGAEESFTGYKQLYEDQALLTKIYLSYPVYISRQCHNQYRQRPGSLMDTAHRDNQYHEVRKYFLDFFENYTAEKNLHPQLSRQLLYKARLPYKSGFINQVEKLLYKTADYLSR
jgi:glycosyltransferase involved in cell wall biosynthesis